MACNVTGRSRIAVLDSIHPAYADVLRTYARGRDLAVDVVSDGAVPAGRQGLSQEHACLAVQHPNFFGCLEDVWQRETAAHAAGALLIAVTDPISLGLLAPPGGYGADIAVAEGQSLGWPVAVGGLVIFPTSERPMLGKRGYTRTQMRHGVSRLRQGSRYTLGVIFHDAR